MDGNPLVSVIIPVNNREDTIGRCLDTVIAQDYRRMQIVVVDDGSKDRSMDICRRYTDRDDRIEIVHKEYGGVSSARNVGLDNAIGDYILFVDSDDWVEKDMVSYLMDGMQRTKSDIAICGYYTEENNRVRRICVQREKVIDSHTALNYLVTDDKIKSYLWNKMFKRELIGKDPFPVGMKFEDIAASHCFFMRAERVVLLPSSKYHYCVNPNGIIKMVVLKDEVDAIENLERRYYETMGVCDANMEFFCFNNFYINFLRRYHDVDGMEYLIEERRIRKVMIDFVRKNYDEFIQPNCNFIQRKVYDEVLGEDTIFIDKTYLFVNQLYSFVRARVIAVLRAMGNDGP